MNKTVLVICTCFIICNGPPVVILTIDPSADLFPEVKENFLGILIFEILIS